MPLFFPPGSYSPAMDSLKVISTDSPVPLSFIVSVQVLNPYIKQDLKLFYNTSFEIPLMFYLLHVQ
jgi:hypothetical protein